MLRANIVNKVVSQFWLSSFRAGSRVTGFFGNSSCPSANVDKFFPDFAALPLSPAPKSEIEDIDTNNPNGGEVGALGRVLRDIKKDLEILSQSIWFAVPKRKQSHARKRRRQMNPLYAAKNAQNFYPCPKCPEGFLKLRHHLCACDQQKLNIRGGVRVTYGNPAQDVNDDTQSVSESQK